VFEYTARRQRPCPLASYPTCCRRRRMMMRRPYRNHRQIWMPRAYPPYPLSLPCRTSSCGCYVNRGPERSKTGEAYWNIFIGSDGEKPPPPPGRPDDVKVKDVPPSEKPLNPENGLGPGPAPGDGPGEGRPSLRPSSPNWSYMVRFCLSLRTSKASDICNDEHETI